MIRRKKSTFQTKNMEDTSYLDELDTLHPEEIGTRICGTDLHAAISNGDFKVWSFWAKKTPLIFNWQSQTPFE